jgi:hypothetical protein
LRPVTPQTCICKIIGDARIETVLKSLPERGFKKNLDGSPLGTAYGFFKKRRAQKNALQLPMSRNALKTSGETGIRTLGTREGTLDFESSPIDRSGISPLNGL